MKKHIIAAAIFMLAAGATKAYNVDAEPFTAILSGYVEEGMKVGDAKVISVDIDDKAKKIAVECNTIASYIPFTAEKVSNLKEDMLASLGENYSKYKISITADGHEIDEFVAGKGRKYIGPKEKTHFITFDDRFDQTPEKGLYGSNIALWQSHGYYFERKLNRWEWQRARTMQTVEDLYTQSYVLPFLMPMLENAGAYVMSPRERDIRSEEVIVDNDGELAMGEYFETGDWKDTGKPGFSHKYEYYNDKEGSSNPFTLGTARMTVADGKSTATWRANVADKGLYAVYVSYQTLPNSSESATYTISASDGEHKVTINQKMGGGTWIYLGHYQFNDNIAAVTLTATGKKKSVVTADGVKIGGGIGNITRPIKITDDRGEELVEYISSQYPRYTEGARYWLQWAGVPDSVYSPYHNENDYNDDYTCRGMWVNWLAGGSSMLPKSKGLNIPIDLSFAFHTDAGTTFNDDIIGTLGIYCTDEGKLLGNKSTRMVSRDFTDLVMTQIVGDVRATFEPNWTRRGMWDQKYRECREPQVPSMLLELLSHQNFADMKYGLDPEFRFTVSRAIYKGMLRFIALRDGRNYVVQPLKVRSFAIKRAAAGKYILSWQPTEDVLEPTAVPTGYRIEVRKNDGPFCKIAVTADTEYEFNTADDAIYSFRITAQNDGGISFPSEVLSLCEKGDNPVMIVNGFTRVSGPDTFDAGEIAGFNDTRDHGVPYIYDINYIGTQFEFRRSIPWMDDDAAGFGASRADFEDKVIAGNTFDYPYIHGLSIGAAGRGFISSSVEAYMNTPLDAPQTVDLILGKQKEIKVGTGLYGTKYKTFPAALQEKITANCHAGGDIFISGAFVATDLWDNSVADPETLKADQEFATKTLGYHWRVDQASVTGEAFEVPSRFHAFGRDTYDFHATLNDKSYIVESPDSFYPADERGETIIRYSENNLIGGVAVRDEKYSTVVIGFPFESIKDNTARDSLMRQILDFFSRK